MALIPNTNTGDRRRLILARRGPKMIPPQNSFNPVDNRYNNAVMGGGGGSGTPENSQKKKSKHGSTYGKREITLL